jgi:acyl-CoA synthetase (NDP forming)/GNAT superfamily N-acetyltransferase
LSTADAVPTGGAAGHPAGWEADVVLSDGGTARVRPIRPDDAARLRAFWERLSTRTIYYRYFGARGPLSDADLRRMTVVDQVTRGALVALIGDELVAAAHWEGTAAAAPAAPGTPAPDAEVAFLVEDAQQGRGLGSVLLEHLAAAASERGIRRFHADVLADNRQMTGVFLDAGYTVSRHWESGTISLSFEITPTVTSVEVMRARERHAEAASIARLLHPRSVAVIGASRRAGAAGNTVLRHLLAGGFAGPVYPVNPAAFDEAGSPGAVASVRAYRSIADVPGPVDVAVVVTPVPALAGVLDECARRGVLALVVLTDLHDPGAEAALAADARARGMRLVGPASLGIQIPRTGFNASLAELMPPVGRVGCYSQSGPLAAALLEGAAARGVGMSAFVSAGDRADVSGNDMLQYWDGDPDTDAILMHLEGFGNPRKFARLARRVGRRAPVIVVTAGRSELDDALLRQAGVIGVERVSRGFDVAALLTSQPLPAGRRVAVIGDSRAMVRLATSSAAAAGLDVEPVVLPLNADPAAFAAALLDAAGRADALMPVVVELPPSDAGRRAAAVAGAARVVNGRAAPVPVLATVLGTRPPPELAPVPGYPSAEGAAAALAHAVRYADWRCQPVGEVPGFPRREDDARYLVARGAGALDEASAAALLACYGIVVIPSLPVTGIEDALAAAGRFGWPVVLKSRSEALTHRPELGGTRLGLGDEGALRSAWASLAGSGGPGPFVVQRMVAPGVSVVVGSVEDPRYGPLVSFGLAGPATDLLGDRAHHILPLTDADAARLVRSVRAAPLLFGYRGSPPVDIDALMDLLLRVARLADDLPDVASLSLNPVIVAESGVSVLGCEIIVRAPSPRPDAGPRRFWSSGPTA